MKGEDWYLIDLFFLRRFLKGTAAEREAKRRREADMEAVGLLPDAGDDEEPEGEW